MFQSTHPRRVWLPVWVHVPSVPSFNPHTHEGCDLVSLSRQYTVPCFNPHTHEGCDLLNVVWVVWKFMFQSTHPRRVWPKNYVFSRFFLVSIHTPTKGVTRYEESAIISQQSFNPHTHEGCDAHARRNNRGGGFQSTHPRRVWRVCTNHKVLRIAVSIHTPTKGVTTTSKVTDGNMQVSIHTPTKGVTSKCCWFLFNKHCFNPHTANSTSKCKITKCFCKSTPLVLRNSISFLVSH